MSRRRERKNDGGIVASVLISTLVHVGLAIWAGIFLDLTPSPLDSREKNQEESRDLKVKVVPEKAIPIETKKPVEQKTEKEREKVEKRPTPQREEEKQEKEEKKEKIEDFEDKKAVVQNSNEESPDEADYLSEQANKTERETRARETTDEFVESSQSGKKQKRDKTEKAPDTKEPKLGSRAVASRAEPKPQPPKPRPPKRQTEPSESDDRTEKEKDEEKKETTVEREPDKPGPKPAPRESERSKVPRSSDSEQPKKLPMPTVEDYERVFDSDADARAAREHREKGVGHDMFRRIEESEGSVRAALENYIGEVQPGNHTSVNAHASKAAAYINRIHHKIHPRWGGDFLQRLDARYGPEHPLSDPSLKTTLELVVDGKTGKYESVNIVESSGQVVYDIEAVSIVKNVAPNPKPPSSIVSPDGNVYIHWNFWRNARQCGTFGVSIYKVNRDGERKEASGQPN